MLRAKDIMSKDAICVKKDTPIFEAVKILIEKNISGLPVAVSYVETDRAGRVLQICLPA